MPNCTICKQNFYSDQGLLVHISRKHKEILKRLIQQNINKKRLANNTQLSKPIVSDNRQVFSSQLSSEKTNDHQTKPQSPTGNTVNQ